MSTNLHELDQRLAGELQKRKIANEMEQIKIKKAIESSEEIKHLRSMIQQGYLNKERAAQVLLLVIKYYKVNKRKTNLWSIEVLLIF